MNILFQTFLGNFDLKYAIKYDRRFRSLQFKTAMKQIIKTKYPRFFYEVFPEVKSSNSFYLIILND